jgi:hypothetical protein
MAKQQAFPVETPRKYKDFGRIPPGLSFLLIAIRETGA